MSSFRLYLIYGIVFLLFMQSMLSLQAQTPWLGKFVEPVYRMPMLQGDEFQLDVGPSQMQFFNEFTTNTFGINGNYLGPVLEFHAGDHVKLYLENNMAKETTMHWHGLHVPAIMDGGPQSIMVPGATWLSEFEVRDQAATYWYHPHPHRMTDEQVTNGLAGMIIIRDAEEAQLDIPRTYNVDDIPLMIQSKAFNINTGEIIPTGSETHFMVNGTIYPYAEFPRQMVRLRLLNGSNLRVLYLGFNDNRPFYQIATDGGLLPEPVELNRVSLATGERAEILVDLSDLDEVPGGKIHMVNFGLEQPPGTPGTPFTNAPNVLDARNVHFLEIRGADPTKDALTEIPGQLREPYARWTEGDVDVIRNYTFEIDWLEFIFSGFLNGFTIDNQPYSHHVINHESQLDDVEMWVLYNNTPFAHPFHIHAEQFQVLDRDGMQPPANEMGRKDVVLVNGGEQVRIITQFTDYTDEENTYMYHCHILSHEDAGMMGQFLVVDRLTSSAQDLTDQGAIADLFPNPTGGNMTLEIDPAWIHGNSGVKLTYYKIFAANGQQTGASGIIKDQATRIEAALLSPGAYVLNLFIDNEFVHGIRFTKL